jgi:hypothetical protein
MNTAPNFLKRILNPGAFPRHIVTLSSYLAICLIFFLDLTFGYQESLQIFYFIPLFVIAYYGEQTYLIVFALVLSIIFQIITLFTYSIQLDSTIIETLIIIFTNITVTYLSLYARHTILANKRASNYYGPERRKEYKYYWPDRRSAEMR